mmetsp:Transcript_12820/g.32954  ORF Transcript_12820/g.32954 Transcript_12820/m.32954 type:complete len:487 (-) Transcript_12820:24-1484(-)
MCFLSCAAVLSRFLSSSLASSKRPRTADSSPEYFSRCLSSSWVRCSLSCSSAFHRFRSLSRVLACASCRITSSTCCLERSSPLITFFVRMSRSCMISTISLLSLSACLCSSSSSFVRPVISPRRALLWASSRCVSASPEAFSFLRASSCRLMRALPVPSAWISSSLAFICICRSTCSSVTLPRWPSSSWYCFFSASFCSSRFWRFVKRRSVSAFSSLIFLSSCVRMSVLRFISSFFALISFWHDSSFCRRSLRSLSSHSLRFCCFSPSSTRSSSWCFRSASSLPPACRSASSLCTLVVRSVFCCCSCTTCPCSMSRCLITSFFSCTSWLTMFSWLMLRPAPCSTRRPSFEISVLRFWIVSLARCSFSWEVSTIFHARSISFFSAVMVAWSSWESLSAVCTLAAFVTISWLSSRHFLIRCFSLSWDFFRARCSFSYSCLKCSSDLSPTSSWRISWKSRSRASKADASKSPSPSLPLSSIASRPPGCL